MSSATGRCLVPSLCYVQFLLHDLCQCSAITIGSDTFQMFLVSLQMLLCSYGCKQMFVEKSHPGVNDAGSGAQMADHNWYSGGQFVSSASSATA